MTGTKTQARWERMECGNGYSLSTGRALIFDNGPGIGPARGGGRWAVEVDGRWQSNEDFLAEAKALALELVQR